MPPYPSLHDVATSPILSSQILYNLRMTSFIAHIMVIVLGIYTRFPVFFVQFTNWTNMMSTVYATFALLSSYYFARPKFYNDASLTKVFVRSRPSKLAHATQILLQLTLPLHGIVTSVFWPLVFPEADTSHGGFDYTYFLLSHGTTLFLLILETLFNKVQFDRKILKFHAIYIFVYALLALFLLYRYNFAVYSFVDFRTSKLNRIILAFIPLLVIIFNEFAILLALLRNKAVKSALDIDIPKIQKRYKRFIRERKSFANESDGSSFE
ncbi:Transmembrane domain-containing protein [Spironucleus salmonicida]|uniref:Transmembrane domain-containing protein n=1 Tax=Spironucleus salmonicida TaxID=348837 RepID=V6LIG0_9EUKA|nr:Transmembrane domain-containing protein [Spironucleus salmonicida]|eukprot:EST44103.1 Transmembrane domain-containing protein [Spironucleus salmonicida]